MELIVNDVRHRGVTQLIIEHDVPFVSKVCDYIIVLAHGRLIAEGNPKEVLEDPIVSATYLGK